MSHFAPLFGVTSVAGGTNVRLVRAVMSGSELTFELCFPGPLAMMWAAVKPEKNRGG